MTTDELLLRMRKNFEDEARFATGVATVQKACRDYRKAKKTPGVRLNQTTSYKELLFIYIQDSSLRGWSGVSAPAAQG